MRDGKNNGEKVQESERAIGRRGWKRQGRELAPGLNPSLEASSSAAQFS